MSQRAWIYIWGILLAGSAVSVLSLLHHSALSPMAGATFALLAALVTGAQLFKAEAPNHMLFHASPVFFFAGVLLPPLAHSAPDRHSAPRRMDQGTLDA